MRRTLQLILASATLAALSAPASASTQTTFLGPKSDFATQACTGEVGPKTSQPWPEAGRLKAVS